MIAPRDIAEAVTAALAFCYVAYNELRIRKLQQADELLKRELSDEKIKSAVNAESSIDTLSKLAEEVKG